MITRRLIWQIPLTLAACIAGSLLAVWLASQVVGFSMNASVVATFSAVLSIAAILAEPRNKHNA